MEPIEHCTTNKVVQYCMFMAHEGLVKLLSYLYLNGILHSIGSGTPPCGLSNYVYWLQQQPLSPLQNSFTKLGCYITIHAL